jgi:hypothetical protein
MQTATGIEQIRERMGEGHEVWVMPKWAAELMWEVLNKNIPGDTFSPELLASLGDALACMEAFEPEAEEINQEQKG